MERTNIRLWAAFNNIGVGAGTRIIAWLFLVVGCARVVSFRGGVKFRHVEGGFGVGVFAVTRVDGEQTGLERVEFCGREGAID